MSFPGVLGSGPLKGGFSPTLCPSAANLSLAHAGGTTIPNAYWVPAPVSLYDSQIHEPWGGPRRMYQLVRVKADSWSRIVDNSPFPKRCILSQSMQRRDDFSRGESDWCGSWRLVTVGSVKEFPLKQQHVFIDQEPCFCVWLCIQFTHT